MLKRILKIKKITDKCAFCDSEDLFLIKDFGKMALAGGFLDKKSFESEPKFQMRMSFCKQCFAVQIIDSIDPNIMFKDYFYFSSSIKTLQNHFKEYAREISERFLNPKQASVLEFGCNDGVLLRPLADEKINTVIGVDPAENVISTIKDNRIETFCDYFNESTAQRIENEFGKMDVVMANNAYAHISDIQGTTKAVKNILKKDGIFIFEVHYLGEVIDHLQYDMVYHEHIYYYSLLSAIEHFKRYEMKVFDIKKIPIHGGSIRFYVCNEDSIYANEFSDELKKLHNEEIAKKYNNFETYERFSDEISKTKKDLMNLLKKLKREGKTIAGYGASGRANTMIQFCEITHEHLDYMIDDAPAKIGFYTPGSHFEIKSKEILISAEAPDYVLIFAWTFFDEIKNKNLSYYENGGKFIIPLPYVSIH